MGNRAHAATVTALALKGPRRLHSPRTVWIFTFLLIVPVSFPETLFLTANLHYQNFKESTNKYKPLKWLFAT
jgi:hypothetical protein